MRRALLLFRLFALLFAVFATSQGVIQPLTRWTSAATALADEEEEEHGDAREEGGAVLRHHRPHPPAGTTAVALLPLPRPAYRLILGPAPQLYAYAPPPLLRLLL